MTGKKRLIDSKGNTTSLSTPSFFLRPDISPVACGSFFILPFLFPSSRETQSRILETKQLFVTFLHWDTYKGSHGRTETDENKNKTTAVSLHERDGESDVCLWQSH